MVADHTEAPGLDGTPYRFVREIGRGGMGSVHEVQHRALGKLFVMKVLHGNLAHRDDFAQRMQREWRTLARLEHPAIVRVTDAGRTAEGLPFFVMERLEGQTLAAALHERGRFAAAEAARVMLTVLSGLEAAHRAGAIHRDIKPQNLFLTADGPKILDFGIVKSRRTGRRLVTRSGVAIGTPRYMAPEQAAGLPVDARADIYACGIVLFEMVAGDDPFAHIKEQAALVGAHINEMPIRLDDLRPEAPAPLGDLLARWLAKEPADRPASARLAQAELRALLPLLDAEAGNPELRALPSPGAALRTRHDESTAGTSGLSTSTSTSLSAESGELAPGRRTASGALETVTLDVPQTSDALRDAGRPPSVTPPPLARADGAPLATQAPASRRPWGLAALVLLTGLGLALGLAVLRPDLLHGRTATAAAAAAPSFDFAETAPAHPLREPHHTVTAAASPPARVVVSPPATPPARSALSVPQEHPPARREGPLAVADAAGTRARRPAAKSAPSDGSTSTVALQLPAPDPPSEAAPSPPEPPAGTQPDAPLDAQPEVLPGSGLW